MGRTPIGLRVSIALALVLVLMTPLTATADDARRDLPPNFVAQHLGAPIANFVLPPGGTSGPISATSPVTAFRFKLRGTIAVNGVPDGGTLAFTAIGEALGANRVHMLLTVSGTGLPTPQAAEISLIGNDSYFRMLTPGISGAGQWIKADSTNGFGTTSAAMPSDLLNGSALLTSAPGLQTLPDKTVDSTLTTHVRMSTDASSASDTFAGTGITLLQAAVDAYIGKSDGKVHRFVLGASARIDLATLADLFNTGGSAATAPPSTGTAITTFTLAMDFTDFNDATIAIAPPANAIPLAQFGTTAGGFATSTGTTPLVLPSPRVLLPPSGVPAASATATTTTTGKP